MIEIIAEGTNLADMNFENAREPEQIQRMKELAEKGECHFCRKGFEIKHTAPIIFENGNWLIAANNFPYTGSVHHYLIVPTQGHPKEICDLTSKTWLELQEASVWLQNYLGVPGASVFVRTGNMAYTGATLDHLHFHFLVGVEKPENVKTFWIVKIFKMMRKIKLFHVYENNLLVTLGFKKK